MTDSTQLGTYLAKAPLSDQEKEGWLKVIPYMAESDLDQLLDILKREQEKIADVRQEYLGKVQKVIDEAKADDITDELEA